MGIEAKERFFEKLLEENEPVGFTSFSTPCFKDCSIISTNDMVTLEQQECMLHLESRWRQERLWENTRGIEKLIERGNDKDEVRDIRGNNYANKSFIIEVQLVNNCNLVNLVDSVDLWLVVSILLFFN